MEVAERRPFPASSAAENGSEMANRNSLCVDMKYMDGGIQIILKNTEY